MKTSTPPPNLTFKQWRALSVPQAVEWWLARMGVVDDMDRRVKLTNILTHEREKEETEMVKSS